MRTTVITRTLRHPHSRARALLLSACLAWALLASQLVSAQNNGGPTSVGLAPAEPWAFGASVSAYFYENQSDYLDVVATVDHGLLHLEGHYNYEALQTGSLWAGLNFSWGKTVQLTLTPMVGGVFGKQNGFAVGLEWMLSWGPLSWFSQPEFVLDLGDASQNNINVWSQLTVEPLGWLELGLALQRTHFHAEQLYVQWGPFIGFKVWQLSLTGYWFDPGKPSSQYWSVTLGLSNLAL